MNKVLLALTLFLLFGITIPAPAAAMLVALQVGMDGPAFSLKDFSGQTVKSADVKGEKLTVLVFWSSWSRKSEAVIGRMQKLYDRYKEKGLSVVGVNADEQKVGESTLTAIRSLQEKLTITYPFLIDDGLTAFHDYGVIALPTTIVMNGAGSIVRELSGYPLVGAEEMAEFLNATMEGKRDGTVTDKEGYKPNKNAIRLFNMGRNTLKSKRMKDTAETWFKKAAEADPGFVLPHLSLGNLYRANGDSDKAVLEFKEVLAREPGSHVALCELANILAEQGKATEGAALLDVAVKGETSYAPCYYYSAFATGKAGKKDMADRLFEEAEKLNPRDHALFVYKARLYEEEKDLKRAAEAYRKAVEMILPQPENH